MSSVLSLFKDPMLKRSNVVRMRSVVRRSGVVRRQRM
jgi:hypothetical protein